MIGFYGTRAFEPKVVKSMAELLHCHPDKLSRSMRSNIYHYAKETFKSEYKRSSRWSALEPGVFKELLSHGNWQPGEVSWLGFPSEELELIDDLRFQLKDLLRVPSEIIRNLKDKTFPAFSYAQKCFQKVVKTSKRHSTPPKIILVGTTGHRQLFYRQ